MKLKQAILSVMGRDALKAAVDELNLDGVDRRSVEEMCARLSRAHRATPELLIEHLGETEVKVVCERIGIDSKGRRSALVESLLQTLPGIKPAKHDRTDVIQESEPVRWMRPEEVKMTEEPTDKPEVQNHRDPRRPFEITRTELVWPGKYDERGKLVEPPRVSLPFQVIEVIKEGRTSREGFKQAMLPLFGEISKGPAEEGWRNKLIWGDNLLVMGSLLRDFAGRIDFIYIDPPFATGQDFTQKYKIDSEGIRLASVNETDDFEKIATILEEVTYRDTWSKGIDTYLEMLSDRIKVMSELMSERGVICIHTDFHVQHFVKIILDEQFGAENFVNEVVWHYYNKMAPVSKCFPRASDRLLIYTKKYGEHVFNKQEEVREEPVKQLKRKLVGGKAINVRNENGEVQYQLRETRRLDDVWRLSCLQPADKTENTGFRTQKPLTLLRRLIRTFTEPDSIVADFFCGSGTSLVAAEDLRNEREEVVGRRRWIGCDVGRYAVHTARKRLLELRTTEPDTGESRGCHPFEILNLGKYERKYWQGITFGNEPKSGEETALAAYVRFILDLYKAQPISGTHIHGKKSGAFVHVGAVDAPVTISQIEDASAEVQRFGGKELHILGWEFEMGLHDPITQYVRAQHGVIVRLLSIPRETMEKRAVEAGDIQFFDLAYLELEIKPEKAGKKDRTVKVVLKDFVIPSTDLIPDEVRGKIKKWSDYIDYWAVDWDFRNDTFVNQWQTYRTRQNRSLALETPGHSYEKPGVYQILVKVVDIFGNDTSHLVRWEVK
jgi:adenine-specific DNA-methyltransferase